MQHLLALEIGTSSIRAAIYDEAGKVLPETTVRRGVVRRRRIVSLAER